MDNQLKLLISLYEEEKVQLQKLIDAYLVEAEYLLAHYHSAALHQVNNKLYTLKSIDDKLFYEKYYKKTIIEGLRQQIDTESNDYIKGAYAEQLQRLKEELTQLEQISPKATSPVNENLLHEMLEKLLDRKIVKLVLMLKKTDNLCLRFHYSNEVLKATLPNVKQLAQKWILNEGSINMLKNFGFDLNKNKLTLILTGNKDSTLLRLMFILSKIVFEVFNYSDFDNESYIQFTDKG